MARFVTITKNTSKYFDYLAAVCFFMVMAVTVINILMRTSFSSPLLGAVELVSVFSVIGIGAALAYSAYNNAQIAVSYFIDKLPRRWHYFIDTGINLISLVFWGIAVYFILVGAQTAAQKNLMTATIHIPIYPVMYVLAAELALLCMVLLVKLINIIEERA